MAVLKKWLILPLAILFLIVGVFALSVSNVVVSSSDGTNTTDENLTVTYDVDNNTVNNVTDWRLNGTSAAIVNMPFENHSDAANTAIDYSTYENNGTVYGAELDAGYVGNSYYFDGSDVIQLGSVNFNNFTDFTYAVWINVDSLSGDWQTIIDADNDEQLLAINAINLYAIYGRCGNDPDGGWGGVGPEEAVWHHIAWVVNGSEYRVYEDGILLANGTGCSDSYLADTLNIGDSSDSVDEPFAGFIDEVLVFNRALSSEEIAVLAANRTDLVVSQETEAGDTWSACVTANDGFDDSAVACSNNLTILAPAAPPSEESPKGAQSSRGALSSSTQQGGDIPPAGYAEFNLNFGDRVNFNVNGESHGVRVTGIFDGVVELEISSDPIRATFGIGETKEFDVNGDGILDLAITLISKIGNSVRIGITSLAGSTTPAPVAPTETPATPAIAEPTPPNLLIGIVVVLVIIGAAYLLGKRKK